jgi:hypothetical protein
MFFYFWRMVWFRVTCENGLKAVIKDPISLDDAIAKGTFMHACM